MTIFFLVAPPVYSFPDLCGRRTISMNEGASHRLVFAVASDPALEAHAKHVLSKKGGSPREKNVYIDGFTVFFKNVQTVDEGDYSICSFNYAGQDHGSFSLTIKCKFQKLNVRARATVSA